MAKTSINFIFVELVLLPGGERGAPSCRSSCVSTHWEGRVLSFKLMVVVMVVFVVMVMVVMVVVVIVEPMCIFWARKALERVLQAPFPRCDTHNGSRIIASWPKIKN